MLERWLENRLLPMAPIRYVSCSLTTLGMLKESSRKRRKQERRGNNHPNPTCISTLVKREQDAKGVPSIYLPRAQACKLQYSVRFYSHSAERHAHKPLQDEEPDKHGAGIYVALCSLNGSQENMLVEFSFH